MMPSRSKRSTRIKACELAATVMAHRTDVSTAPLLWSLAVFFENYIDGGAKATMKDFGPNKPVKLMAVK